jgi:hypothetical protein
VSRYTDSYSNKPFTIYNISVKPHEQEAVTLTCAEPIYAAFLDNGTYDVFYAPHTGTILSAEFVRSTRHEVEKQHQSPRQKSRRNKSRR